MNRRTTVLVGTFALVGGAGLAQAQAEAKPRTGVVAAAPRQNPPPTPAPAKPRTASIPPSPPAQPASIPTTGYVNNFVAPPASAAHVVQVYYLPTVLLSDGRVMANFGTGRGYEQVLRRCPPISGPIPPGFATTACWTVDPSGRYSVIQQR